MIRTLTALSLALLFLWPAPAAARPSWEREATPTAVAAHLAEDPVYLHSEQHGGLPEDLAQELRERVLGEEMDVYIAVTPWRDEPHSLATALVNRAQRDGVYLVVGTGHTMVAVSSEGGRVQGPDPDTVRMALAVVNERPDLARAPLAGRLNVALDLLGDEEVTASEYERLSSGAPRDRWLLSDGFMLITALPLAALVFWGLLWGVRRRSRRPLRVVPLTEAVVDSVDSAKQEAEHRELTRVLPSYGRRVARFGGVHTRATAALEAYEAAARVLDSADDMSDLVGVRVLLDHCEAALTGGSAPQHCFFDPRHPGDAGRVRWRVPATHRAVTVRACADCRRDVKGYRMPKAVLDTSGARPVPYYAVPAERSVWAATGYGTLAPDLAARILRGELRG